MRRVTVVVGILLLLPQLVVAAPFDHSDWGLFLSNNVKVIDAGKATQVDYGAMAKQRPLLETYLGRLSEVSQDEFDAWSTDDQLAFLINAYNSWTVKLILTKYPDLDSIKDLGSLFRSPWKKSFIPLLGKTRSLDDLEHGLIRGSGRYDDPRIHFAVNCASVGCPALRNEPYIGSTLKTQLEAATSDFLKDRTRNRLKGGRLEVSSLFKWYREDFEKNWMGVTSLEQFFADHAADLQLSVAAEKMLRAGDLKILFLDYDWRLNRTP